MLPWRAPDKPIEIHNLRMVREGEYLAQRKLDGHNCVIIRDEGTTKVMSRHNKTLGVSVAMRKAIEALAIPDGSVLNAEWTSRREAYRQEELYFFDILYWNKSWVGTFTTLHRYEVLTNWFDSMRGYAYEMIDGPKPTVFLVQSQDKDYAGLYKSCVDDMKTEGIVLKHKESKLIGDLRDSAHNPKMFKLKWRIGADGMTKRIVPDSDLVTQE